ncbi:helix-turn-helix transcriptional regulator [Salipaludibacillus daqingensis]|uniref:helix-turn-helix transcriptional regulator n=1 Tax=Salipaludibacillus daqingensis TaxID=3041001 RepID=UPI00247645DA|nr:helix-turn-helix transcriptional regulator [Salipaludibacillus daqingensis]
MNKIYTPEEVAQLLQISKHTVYELIKRKELNAFKVGNKMRIEEIQLEHYKKRHSTIQKQEIYAPNRKAIRLHGSHDILLEKICQIVNHENSLSIQPSFIGSLEGCMSLYREECDIAAVHLYDQARKQYNVPIVEQFFPDDKVTVVHLTERNQGFITKKGNPKKIFLWEDLLREDITFVNRQPGSGTRQLIDQQLKDQNISSSLIDGYENIEWTHYAAANQLMSEQADVTIGIEPIAHILGLSFEPISKESFDLIFKWTDSNKQALTSLLEVLQSDSLKNSVKNLSGYDVSNIGKIMQT